MTHFIPETILDQIKHSIDIIEVISNHVRLTKSGKNFKGLCPFHSEKTPSFLVSPEKQIFHCFGCGQGGDIFTFIQQIEKINFPESVRQLASRARISIPTTGPEQEKELYTELYGLYQKVGKFYYERLASDKNGSAYRYLKNRNLSDSTIRQFGLGYASDQWEGLTRFLQSKKIAESFLIRSGLVIKSEKNKRLLDFFRQRVIFPIFDPHGKVVGFGGRTLSQDNHSPKYINSPESPIFQKRKILYGIQKSKESIRSRGFAILVEGYMDFLQLYQSGIQNVAAPCGTALTEDHARLLKRYCDRVLLIFDPDTAGQNAALRTLPLLLSQNFEIKLVALPQGEDPDTFIRKNGKEVFLKLIEKPVELMDFLIHSHQQLISGKHDLKSPHGKKLLAEALLEPLRAMTDALKKDEYLRMIADKIGVRENILREMFQKATYPRLSSYNPEPPLVPQILPLPAIEKELLSLILNHPPLIPILKEKISWEDFQSPAARDLFKEILSENQTPFSIHHLLQQSTNPDYAGLIRELVLVEDKRGNPEQRFHDCVSKIKNKKIELLMAALKQRYKSASETERPKILSEYQDLKHEQRQFSS